MTVPDPTLTAPARPWIKTPLLESHSLSKIAGCRIFLKLDLLQPSGSFKSRGIGNLIYKASLASPGRALHIYSSSAGNAGLAAATASFALGLSCTVVVPRTTTEAMKQKLWAAGATRVETEGDSWVDADARVRVLVAGDADGVYCSPFDHPDVWEGNRSLVEEVVEELGGAPEGVVVSVGGGGLLCGVLMGLRGEGRVVAVETRGAESLSASLCAGELVGLQEVTSIATSLGAKMVARRAWEMAREEGVVSRVVTDGMAARACVRFAEEERMLVEAACGASLAVVYELGLKKVLPELTSESRVVVVVCGGSNVNLEMLERYKKEYPLEKEEVVV